MLTVQDIFIISNKQKRGQGFILHNKDGIVKFNQKDGVRFEQFYSSFVHITGKDGFAIIMVSKHNLPKILGRIEILMINCYSLILLIQNPEIHIRMCVYFIRPVINPQNREREHKNNKYGKTK